MKCWTKSFEKTNAQSSTDQPTEVDLERLFVDAYQATGAELLQQSGMAESTETFDTSDPLTPFLAYVLFVLHYRNNPFSGFLAHLQTLRNARNSRSEKSCVGLLQAMVNNLTQ